MLTLRTAVVVSLATAAVLFGPVPPVRSEAPSLFRDSPVLFERVATGYGFTEGPAPDPQGDIYFSDIRNARILRFDVAKKAARVVREDSGKANGLLFDSRGRLHACEGGRRRLVRFDAGRVKEAGTVLADRFGGRRLNSPNDLALDAQGGVWFTDPRYGKQDDLEQDVMAVYYQPAQGALRQVIRDLPRPNGIVLAADGRTLFVAASSRKRIMAYPVTKPGVLGTGRVFAELDPAPRGGPDGMTLDAAGNLYCAGQGHLFVWSKAGKRLYKLKVPESPTNCAFGGPKRDTLYVTARTSLYRVPMTVRGAR